MHENYVKHEAYNYMPKEKEMEVGVGQRRRSRTSKALLSHATWAATGASPVSTNEWSQPCLRRVVLIWVISSCFVPAFEEVINQTSQLFSFYERPLEGL